MYLILVGILVHLVFLASIFDIYFTSPIVHGMPPQPMPPNPPAKRLCLFVSDGLRADKFFEPTASNRYRAPFLHNITLHSGTSGISHTRVPTESRPGHVALIAGFYEDPSAVTKGWKENPVEFDSVFNRSRYTWAWGSPDIVDIFTRVKGHDGVLRRVPNIFGHTYSADFEDFAASPALLDTWVFDQFTEFLKKAETDRTLWNMMNEDKVIFFFHLLGMDTTGHVYKPYSKTHDDNLLLVDQKIQEILDKVDDFFGNDKKTAFIFTSDHGMTDWGSHGSGGREETATPLVAWGAGVPEPRFSKGFLDRPDQVDVNQADLTPLMASLIGIPIPVNSVGTLPLKYLDASDVYKRDALLANAQQSYEQLLVKMELKKSQTFTWLFRPYGKLDEVMWKDRITGILNKNSSAASDTFADIEDLLQLVLEGQLYYQNYDRRFLSVLVVLGYLGWMAYILIILLDKRSYQPAKGEASRRRSVLLTGMAASLVWTLLMWLRQSARPAFMYGLLPIGAWTAVLTRWPTSRIWTNSGQPQRTKSALWSIILFVAGTEVLVFTFFYRPMVSVGLILTGLWLAYLSRASTLNKLIWISTSIGVAVFPFLDVIGKSRNTELVYWTGAAAFIVMLVMSFLRPCDLRSNPPEPIFLYGQIVAFLIGFYIFHITSQSISAQIPSGTLSQTISWILLISSFLVPLLGATLLRSRFLNVFISLFTGYLLMSISYEALFLLLFFFHLYQWIILESHTQSTKLSLSTLTIFDSKIMEKAAELRAVKLDDVRRAFFFVFFILTAFFGTGNIASINSFDPASAFCFVTVFRPFVMGTILLCKVIIPFLLVGCAFHVVHVVCKLPMSGLFLIVLLISDFMALHFFFMVKTEGSWLDIGTSISHYVMVMALIVFTSVLTLISSVLMSVKIRVHVPRFRYLDFLLGRYST